MMTADKPDEEKYPNRKPDHMTEAIFDAVSRDMDRVSQWFTRRHDGRHTTLITGRNPEVSNVLTDMHNAVADGLANIKGWAADLEAKLPEIEQRALAFEGSPIVQALEGAILPPGVEQDIAALISRFKTVSDPSAGSVPAPAAPPAAA